MAESLENNPRYLQLLAEVAGDPFLSSPEAKQRMIQGFTRRTNLSPEQEAQFRREATALGHPARAFDDPTYDLRAAWLAGQLRPKSEHGSSEFKGLGDERLFLPIGTGGQVLETRTAQPTPSGGWTGETPNPQMLGLWRYISSLMNPR